MAKNKKPNYAMVLAAKRVFEANKGQKNTAFAKGQRPITLLPIRRRKK